MNDSVITVAAGDRTFYLLGTAHVSADSVRDVEAAIDPAVIDAVVVEIDDQRYRTVVEGRDWAQLDVFQIIRRKQAFLLLGNLVLASFQRRIGGGTGVEPGAEMIAATHRAREAGIPVIFGDRPIQATLRRAWAKTGLWGRSKLLASMIASVVSREEVTEEDLARMREQSELDAMLAELADYLPAVKKVLIDERDAYMAQKIVDAPGQRILAVVGAGHVPGMVRWIQQIAGPAGRGAMEPAAAEVTEAATPATESAVATPMDTAPAAEVTEAATPKSVKPTPVASSRRPRTQRHTVDIAELERIPPPTAVARALPWVIPIVVVSLIGWGFFRGGVEGGLQGLYRWIVVNGTLSAIGALVAAAHPLTIIAAFVGAPITSMNPTIGVGFVTGLIEAFLRKPRVADLQRLNDDIVSIRGFYRNRLTRILLVFFFSSLGSSIGTFIALPLLFP